MSLPEGVKYLVVGAGIHGLSTAYHLAKELKAHGRGSGKDILVIDKKAIGAGASGIACGVVRNNYFQPAMRRLMAHCVSIWERHAETLSYHSVGYMQISPESMHAQVGTIYEQEKAIGYPSVFIEGAKDCDRYMKDMFTDWQAKNITSVLHEKKGGYANNMRSMEGLAALARAEGVRIETGVKVIGFERANGASSAVRAVITDKGKIKCDEVIVGVGPWVKQIWDMLQLPEAITVKGRDGKLYHDRQMWTFWSLQEGTLGVDPRLQRTNAGDMPPVIHVDTDAPLYDDRDGSLITDKLWGIYYKPDFYFGGVQGGAMPFPIQDRSRQGGRRSIRPRKPRLHRRRGLQAHVGVGAGPLPGALPGSDERLPRRAVGRHRLLHAGQFSGLRSLLRERLHHRRQQPRLQDDRRRRSRRQGTDGAKERPARAVPLHPLRQG